MNSIIVTGASTNNLKDVHVQIPHNQFTVVTGVSGSGKSSLVFDTIFSEGHRRYIDTLSTYMRQFIEKVEPPDVKEIRNILPAIALKQYNPNHNSRSTVGTVTEISNFLAELFSAASSLICDCGHEVKVYTIDEIIRFIQKGNGGKKIFITAEIEQINECRISEVLSAFLQYGFIRVITENNQALLIEEILQDEDLSAGSIPRGLRILVDRFSSDSDEFRIRESLQLSQKFFNKSINLLNPETGEEFHFSVRHVCPSCKKNYPEPSRHLFSFNSPIGACHCCQGFGAVGTYPEEKLIPNPGISIEQGAIDIVSKPSFSEYFQYLLSSCRRFGIPVDLSYKQLSPEHRRLIFEGNSEFEGLNDFIKALERKRYKKHISIMLSRLREYSDCPECRGMRLNETVRRFFIQGKNLPETEDMEIAELRDFVFALMKGSSISANHSKLLSRIAERLDYLVKVGLPYLTLNRTSRTLSGGEYQRIRLASLLGTSLYNTLYVLDEPTIGLHGADSTKLIGVLKDLRDRDNTIVAVEHDPDFILNSDYVVELGPEGGATGGYLTFQGTIRDFLSADTLTNNEIKNAVNHLDKILPKDFNHTGHALTLKGVSCRNIRSLDLVFPHNAMIAVTGVSGSGKSTLMNEILQEVMMKGPHSLINSNKVKGMEGIENFSKVILVSQDPIGKSTRSVPATFLDVFTDIRRIFSDTAQAKYRGLGKGDFSFNSGEGRCPECSGSGYSCVDLLFLPDLMLPCHVCNGKRFSKEILDITYNGKNIDEVLKMTISDAAEFFASDNVIPRVLKFPILIGIGYLQLGQVTSSLSGGELQRLKLSRYLQEECGSNLVLLDEPTTGLHMKDIRILVDSLKLLIETGATIVTVEHNPYFIASCDWVIDLGPGGGNAGGNLIYQGTTKDFVKYPGSSTASYIREFFRVKKVDLD